MFISKETWLTFRDLSYFCIIFFLSPYIVQSILYFQSIRTRITILCYIHYYRLYSSRKEEKPVIIEKLSNFFKTVSESKEVTKMYSMLSGCMQGIKMEFTDFIKIWNRCVHCMIRPCPSLIT